MIKQKLTITITKMISITRISLVNNMQSGLQTDVCVLDFSKAFDEVGHRHLSEKLKMYGIDGETNTWITDFLSDCTVHTISVSRRFIFRQYPGYLWCTTGVRARTVSLPVLYQRYCRWTELNCRQTGQDRTDRQWSDRIGRTVL